MNDVNLPLPSDTRSILKDEKYILSKTSNLGLLFNKYAFVWSKDWDTEEIIKGKKVNKKAEFIRKIKDAGFYAEDGKDYVSYVHNRRKAIIQSLKNSNWQVEHLEMMTDTRLILGLGGTSVIETGITLHPLYGFPYLPASGLKGLARAYAEIVYNASRDELLAIFGSESKDMADVANNQQGKVFFMDGLPTEFPELDLDIMNPHYSEYYQGDKPPADYLNPVPVTFLAVAPGQRFSFGIYSKDAELLNKAKVWLVGGVTELGAGGKTNVDYGYFKECEQKTSQNQQSGDVKVEEDNSLAARFNKLKLNCNPEKFVEFIKSVKTEERDALKDISFKGMDSINTGLVPYLDGREVSSDVIEVIAEKMLEVIQPKKKWNDAKREKYKKLISLAGKEIE